jgi:uncharacterized cofD-like protein
MKMKRIVTIGGGTGSFTLLSGLKKYPVAISAIVSMADDGGSTGVLRDELGVLPPGDVRQCLVALSESSEKLRTLMNYRFENGGLSGHSFGNLLLSALEKTSGSFASGVEEAMEILKVHGEVIPVTEGDGRLELELLDGTVLRGENEINHHKSFQKIGVKELRFEGTMKAYGKALARIRQADLIVIGPGNLYCSLLPNFILKDFSLAIKKSRAKVVYVSNLTNKKGHTIGFDVDDYVATIERYIGNGRIDYVLFPSRRPGKALVEKYERMEGKNTLVAFRKDTNPKRGYEVVMADIVSGKIPKMEKSDAVASTRAFIRHDSERLARTVMFLLDLEMNRRIVKEII